MIRLDYTAQPKQRPDGLRAALDLWLTELLMCRPRLADRYWQLMDRLVVATRRRTRGWDPDHDNDADNTAPRDLE